MFKYLSYVKNMLDFYSFQIALWESYSVINPKSVYSCLFLFLFQVEFSYPPIIPGAGHDSNTLPEEWKYLPFLALPDGAHNHQEGKVSVYTTLY